MRALYTGESGTGRSGAVHRYYKCNGAKYKHACDKKTVKKEWIENIVIKYTREMMMSDNVLEDIASIVFRNFQKENPVIQLLKQRLSETETALNNLLKAIEEGIITSTTKQRMLELEHTRDEINLKLIKEEMKKPTITKEGLKLWLKQIQTMSLETKEHKQRLIDCFVNAVYLYDDKLVITFNYKEASKTVTLKEVNGSIIECSGAPRYGDSPKAISVSYCRRCFEILVLLSFAARKTTGFDRTSTYSPAHTVSISQNRGSSSYGYLRIFLYLIDNSFIMRYNVQYITKGVLLCATLGWMTI